MKLFVGIRKIQLVTIVKILNLVEKCCVFYDLSLVMRTIVYLKNIYVVDMLHVEI
jgi:hypothetical protein